MELQRILFPNEDRCKEKELYFRTSADGEFAEGIFSLAKGECVAFDTYFNAFSIEKWKKYTIVSSVFLRLELSGKWKISLLSKELRNEVACETVLSEHIVETEVPGFFEFRFEEDVDRGLYAFKAEVLSEDGRLYGGAYCTDLPVQDRQNVKIGICICTYRREKYIERNLQILKEEILDNKESPAYGHLEVFIADNGRSLDQERLQTDLVHLYPNRNLGGTGGFTRGLIEICNNNSILNVTHVLFMDDDVVIEPEAIVKTYLILSLIRSEHKEAFIGGAMLSLDEQYMQIESGALWNGGSLRALKSHIDMRRCENCICNEYEEAIDYNGWWYCCFPITIADNDNLPLPMFIRRDDIEYGLRNMRESISMNGICVWHEPFDNKYSAYLEYYTVRNQLITNAFHCEWYGAKHLRKEMLSRCVQEIMFYRYKSVELYLQGILDYLKGPGWLETQDGEKLNNRVVSMGYTAQPVRTLEESYQMRWNQKDYELSCHISDVQYGRVRRWITFNGLFLPAKGENCVPMAQTKTIQFYRKKRVLHYNESNQTGFITEKSILLSLKYIIKMIWVMLQVTFRYKKVQAAYATDGKKLRTYSFWKNYIEGK